MREEYLHFIWRNKRIPIDGLNLIDGRKLEIIYFGDLNKNESGPDFSNCKIKIDNIIWVGNIEFHVKSSDWLKHNHHKDNAYNSVILHVVYQHDKEIICNNEVLPTLELVNLLDHDHFVNFDLFFKQKSTFICTNQLKEIEEIFVRNQIEKVFYQRIETRANKIKRLIYDAQFDYVQVMYELFASCVFGKINALPAIEYTKRLNYSNLRRIPENNRDIVAKCMSGLMETNTSLENDIFDRYCNLFHLEPMQRVAWKMKGNLPNGFPDRRLIQFLTLVQQGELFSFLDCSFSEWKKWFIDLTCISTDLKDKILINIIVPFLYYQYKETLDTNYLELCMFEIEQIASEKNSVIREWEKIGVTSKSAMDSQGLLELKNEFCEKKKCLSCQIGNRILNR